MKWASGLNLPGTHAKPTFSEAWFNRNYGLTFGREYCTDPIFRTEQDMAAMRLLFERFGSLGIEKSDPKPRPHLEIAGHRFASALLGCEIIYQDDQAPATRHISAMTPADIAAISKPDLETNAWARDFRRQGEILIDKYGFVDATINYGGPINIASNTFGTDAFIHLADPNPEFRAFLQMAAELCIECYDRLTLPLSPNLDRGREMFIGNCPVMMLDPKTYRAEIMPADEFIRERVVKFGLHHCGPMDRYLADYAMLWPLDYIEVGWGSDLAMIREAFPGTMLDLLINVYDLQQMTADAMRELISDMMRRAAPETLIRDIWVADIGPEVADEVVVNFVEAVNSASRQ